MGIELKVISVDLTSTEGVELVCFDKNDVSIGREEENDLVLRKHEVSPRHARITLETNAEGKSQLFITDLSSSNGIALENEQIESNIAVPFEEGDRVLIGTYLIKVRSLEDKKSETTQEEAMGAEDIDEIRVRLVEDPKLAENSYEQFIDGEQSTLELESSEEKSEESELAKSLEASLEKRQLSDSADDSELLSTISSIEAAPTSAGVIYLGDADAKQEQEEDQRLDLDCTSASELACSESCSEVCNGEDLKSDFSKLAQKAGVMGAESIIDFNFEAFELFNVKGKVLHHGSGLEGVEVDGGALGTTLTDENGGFLFDEIPEGAEFSIQLKKDGFILEGEGIFSGQVASDMERTMIAKRLNSIRGRVLHRGKALVGVEIDGGPLGKTITDEDGSYLFLDVPEDLEFVITASKAGFTFPVAQSQPSETLVQNDDESELGLNLAAG